MPLVSVVMPVYNREIFVAEAIESILEQTFSDFEFVIVDDGSQDRSPEIIRQYERRDDRIRFLAFKQNKGKAAAKNFGIEAAQGQYIAGMDSDDVSLPQRLEKQVEFLRANPDIGVVGTRARLTD
ncbi:MAG: glycosyltransferase family 2 protein, partial [Chloroflexi bacterium]|nr:glycosyltransferase family 2 protein [Chloroflexota bacterium]